MALAVKSMFVLDHSQPLTPSSNFIRVPAAFGLAGICSGLVFAFITSRDRLRDTWYFRTDKFFVPKLSYWVLVVAVFSIGVVIVHRLVKARFSTSGKLGTRINEFLFIGTITAAAPILYSLNDWMNSRLGASWYWFFGPLVFMFFFTVGVAILSNNPRWIVFLFLLSTTIAFVGVVVMFGFLRLFRDAAQGYDGYIEWTILHPALAATCGLWLSFSMRFRSVTSEHSFKSQTTLRALAVGLILCGIGAVPSALRSGALPRSLPRAANATSSRIDVWANLTAKSTTSAIKRLCFERYDLNERTDVLKPWIFLKDFTTGSETRLIKGGTPDISPTGEEIAFTDGHMYDLPKGFGDPVPSAGRVDPFRIQVMDLRTRKVRDFQSLAGLRHYHPLWSPDGESIAFVFLNHDEMRADVGVMDNATGNWKKISTDVDLGNPAESITIDCWAADNRSLLFHTYQDIYEVGLDGRLLRKIPTTGLNVTTSDTRFLMSSDKSFLVFSRTDDTARGPNEVLYVFDIKSNKVSRLTPEGMAASSPRWLVLDREILFSCATSDTKRNRSDICRINVDGTGFSKIIEDGDYSSISTR